MTPPPSTSPRSTPSHDLPPDRQAGQATLLMALMLGTFLMGFIALGLDVQYLFRAKRLAQSAADAAALAAAEESSNGVNNEQLAANAVAKLNGFDTTLATNPATVTLSTPTSGSYSGSASYMQAVVTMPVPTLFMGVLNHKATFTISARAVAANGQTSPTCVCLEGTSGQDLNMSNGTSLTATSCGVTVNSTASNAVGVVGGSTLSATSLGIASSTWTSSANVNNGGSITGSTKVVTGVSTQCSPALPAVPSYSASQCTADPGSNYSDGGSSYAVGPGSAHSTTQSGNLVCYNSLLVGANGDAVTLNPGIYVINGGQLHFESGSGGYANAGGSGVFFYLLGGASLVVDNGANTRLTASTTGTYANTLMYEDASDTQAFSFQGGSSSIFSGTIYLPSAALTIGNGATLNSDVVAQSLTLTGGGILQSAATTNMGTMNLSVAKVVE